MAVSKRLRYEILLRDNHTCRYCGASAPDVKLTIDHVTPVALGGEDIPENLVAACAACNSGKSSTTPGAALVADVSADALRWAEAMDWARVVQRMKADDMEANRDYFARLWHPEVAPHDWAVSIDRFYEERLSIADLEYAVRVAKSRYSGPDCFPYFCGIAWNKVRETRNLAREYLDREEAVT